MSSQEGNTRTAMNETMKPRAISKVRGYRKTVHILYTKLYNPTVNLVDQNSTALTVFIESAHWADSI